MAVKKCISSGAKSSCCALFCRRSRNESEIVGRFFGGNEDRGRKAKGKKTKAKRIFLGDILHPLVEDAEGANNLLTAALSCLDIFAQIESSESSTV